MDYRVHVDITMCMSEGNFAQVCTTSPISTNSYYLPKKSKFLSLCFLFCEMHITQMDAQWEFIKVNQEAVRCLLMWGNTEMHDVKTKNEIS